MFYYSDMSTAGQLDVGPFGFDTRRTDNAYAVYYSQLNFRRSFNEHTISALAGYQQEYNKASNLAGGRLQYTTNFLKELDAGPKPGMTNSGTSSEWAIRSFYGNVNYDFQDKYLFGTSVRYDGTSRLPEDTRWGCSTLSQRDGVSPKRRSYRMSAGSMT